MHEPVGNIKRPTYPCHNVTCIFDFDLPCQSHHEQEREETTANNKEKKELVSTTKILAKVSCSLLTQQTSFSAHSLISEDIKLPNDWLIRIAECSRASTSFCRE